MSDPFEDTCENCGAPLAGDLVCVPRAQHAALMAAAKALVGLDRRLVFSVPPIEMETVMTIGLGKKFTAADKALAALRAAGIDLEEKTGGNI